MSRGVILILLINFSYPYKSARKIKLQDVYYKIIAPIRTLAPTPKQQVS
jgi:hypothetical protein